MRINLLEFITVGVALIALLATMHYCTPKAQEIEIVSHQQSIAAVKELMRIESEIRKEQERRRIQAEINSMYLPPYIGGC